MQDLPEFCASTADYCYDGCLGDDCYGYSRYVCLGMKCLKYFLPRSSNACQASEMMQEDQTKD